MTDILPDQTLRDDFIKALAEDFAAHGVAAIVAYREDKPADYLKIIASILPKDAVKDAQKKAAHDVEALSDDELLARIRSLDGAIAALQGTGCPEGGAQAAAGDTQAVALPALCQTTRVP